MDVAHPVEVAKQLLAATAQGAGQITAAWAEGSPNLDGPVADSALTADPHRGPDPGFLEQQILDGTTAPVVGTDITRPDGTGTRALAIRDSNITEPPTWVAVCWIPTRHRDGTLHDTGPVTYVRSDPTQPRRWYHGTLHTHPPAGWLTPQLS